jgi:multidrug efflux pump subunit AcrB
MSVQSQQRPQYQLRDLSFEQELEYPAVKVDIQRAVAGAMGVTADQVARSLIEATSSSRFTVPNFWADRQERHRISSSGADSHPENELP